MYHSKERERWRYRGKEYFTHFLGSVVWVLFRGDKYEIIFIYDIFNVVGMRKKNIENINNEWERRKTEQGK